MAVGLLGGRYKLPPRRRRRRLSLMSFPPCCTSPSQTSTAASANKSDRLGYSPRNTTWLVNISLATPTPRQISGLRGSVTLDFLARFLSKVADQEKKNRMNAKSLAVVLSPNLLRNPEGDPQVFKVRATTDAGRFSVTPVRLHGDKFLGTRRDA